MERLKIILVDDHTLFRNGLRGLLDRSEACRVVAEAGSGEEFLELLPRTEADVVFMDFSMPGIDGAEATERALLVRPGLKIITLSVFGDESYYSRMVEAGAKGFLLKDSDIGEGGSKFPLPKNSPASLSKRSCSKGRVIFCGSASTCERLLPPLDGYCLASAGGGAESVTDTCGSGALCSRFTYSSRSSSSFAVIVTEIFFSKKPRTRFSIFLSIPSPIRRFFPPDLSAIVYPAPSAVTSAPSKYPFTLGYLCFKNPIISNM